MSKRLVSSQPPHMKNAHYPRIVSMVPCATEIVCALGFSEHLVGRSHECDVPEWVKHLPVCTEPNFSFSASSRETNDRVQERLQAALSVYRVNTHRLAELRPDLIVTQAQCDVCAVSLDEVERAIGHTLTSRPQVISLQPKNLSDLWDDIARVGENLDSPQRAAQLIAQMQERIAAIGSTARSLFNQPTVACIEWIDPLMAAANWIPELVEIAGGRNLFGTAGEHSPWLRWGDLCTADPEVIIVMPCGFDITRSRQDMSLLARRLQWPRLRAVMNGRVYLTDGNQYFNRPGPRLVDSLEILAEVLCPETFRFGHEGIGWQRF